MDQIKINGQVPLKGVVQVGGAKNSALPLLFATLLSDQACVLDNIPDLQDIKFTLEILAKLGAKLSGHHSAGKVTVDCSQVNIQEAPYDLVRKMRASILCLGPLLARYGRAKVSLPGGCAIGNRPVDIHLKGMEALGAQIEIEQGYVIATAKKLKGARILLDFPSVGATENLMMAAALADGVTTIENAAREPEIEDLAAMLTSMGVLVSGAGTSKVEITGATSLKRINHKVIGDRIEAGTYLAAAFATLGSVRVEGVDSNHLTEVIEKFKLAGATVQFGSNWIHLEANNRARAIEMRTAPHPGFPTDMQAQFMAVLTTATGVSTISEVIFENRFMHVPELCRLGADIKVRGDRATVTGVDRLKGAQLMATDLRASASLVIAALSAQGESTINRVYHLDRGYEKLEEKLKKLGAQIERVSV